MGTFDLNFQCTRRQVEIEREHREAEERRERTGRKVFGTGIVADVLVLRFHCF